MSQSGEPREAIVRALRADIFRIKVIGRRYGLVSVSA